MEDLEIPLATTIEYTALPRTLPLPTLTTWNKTKSHDSVMERMTTGPEAAEKDANAQGGSQMLHTQLPRRRWVTTGDR
jgi:hypothetical protein